VTIKLTTGQRILVGVSGVILLVIILSLSLSLGVRNSGNQSAVIPASVVVDRALQVANEQSPTSGGSLTPPTAARGQITTYGQAYQFIFQQAPDPSNTAAPNATYPVWLIVLQGQFVEHVPASAGGDIPAKDVLHTQLAMILDGDTTQTLAQVLVSPTRPLDVSALPLLPLPVGGPSATTTPEPTSIFAPATEPTP